MEIPGVGSVTKDDEFGWYYTEQIKIPGLRGQTCRIVLEGYEDDPAQAEFHVAIANLLSTDRDLLGQAEPYIYEYYKDTSSCWAPGGPEFIEIPRESLWQHVQVGKEPMIIRRAYGDRCVYVSIECNCDWEPEHGLQLVFREGRIVKKVGPYDGHLANSDAFADDQLENVVYHSGR